MDLTAVRQPKRVEEKAIRPKTLPKGVWPPSYDGVFAWRYETLKTLKDDPKMIKGAKLYYQTHPVDFILDWLDTYDPRKAMKWMPFIFFARQEDVINFFEDCNRDQESGIVEKCRDFGLTWLACAYSVWRWLFIPDDAVGWGSRKESLVDKPGDPDSIFEKMRLMVRRMPAVWLPEDFKWGKHSTFMKLMNPNTGAIIAGESGDNIGRGGRSSMYFLDEAAHIERAEKVEAALGDNTNVRIDISSVNGVGNVFHRRREHGQLWTPDCELDKGFVRVFVADWRDHPGKSQEWYDNRKARYDREGMSHVFAQEVDREYTASISNVVIPHEWVINAIDAHIHVPYFAEAYEKNKGQYSVGLDVADEGGDRNALTVRNWVVWEDVFEWGERDPGVTARKAISICRDLKGVVPCQYDCVGVGAGVKTEYNRIAIDEKLIDGNKIPFIPWNAGSGVEKPHHRIIPDDKESLKNKDFFDNLKAQAWWSLRTRFFKTFKARTEGAVYPADELISLNGDMRLIEQLKKELIQPTRGQSSRLKMLIEKKKDGMKSPNLADSGVQAFFPLGEGSDFNIVGKYGF